MNFSDAPPLNRPRQHHRPGRHRRLRLLGDLPAGADVDPPGSRSRRRRAGPGAASSASASGWSARRKPLLWGMTAAVIAIIAFDPGQPAQRSLRALLRRVHPSSAATTDYAFENLTGIYQHRVLAPRGRDRRYQRIRPISPSSTSSPPGSASRKGSIHVSTLSPTPCKRLNMNMHGDDPAYFRLPEERDLAAQYLLLYRDVPALRPRSEQPDQRRQELDPVDRHGVRHPDGRST